MSIVCKDDHYWLYHAKSLKDDSFKNHADFVWRIVKYEHNNGRLNHFKL